jgi:integrase
LFEFLTASSIVIPLSELRRLFGDAGRNRPDGHRKYDPDTLRSLLSFLYSTGALVREAIELRVSEIDLKTGQATRRRRDGDYKRTLPIGKTMVKRLAALFVLNFEKKTWQ